jgi:hypothetical protein
LGTALHLSLSFMRLTPCLYSKQMWIAAFVLAKVHDSGFSDTSGPLQVLLLSSIQLRLARFRVGCCVDITSCVHSPQAIMNVFVNSV